ncbi:MAG: class I SAM-dependent methyltransferase [Patescibacteria group bacterium]|nr:class I SAM-dependent methyltransferase [Patescibacteria group bacterium]
MMIYGWFDERNRRELERLIEAYHVRTVIEVGSFLGLSTLWFAERVEHVYCVDLFSVAESDGSNVGPFLKTLGLPVDFYDVFLSNIAPYQHKITVIRSRSTEAQVPNADLAYIDADHTYAGCKADIAYYSPKVGIISGDDYSVTHPGVMRAVDETRAIVCAPFWYSISGAALAA